MDMLMVMRNTLLPLAPQVDEVKTVRRFLLEAAVFQLRLGGNC